MPIDPTYLFYGVVFIGALLLAEGAYYLYTDAFGGKRAANRRMRMLSGGTDAESVLFKLRRDPPASWAKLGALGALLTKFDRLITQSGLTTPLKSVLLVAAGISIVLFAAVAIYKGIILARPSTAILAVILCIAIGFAVPTFYLMNLKARRIKKFETQLPDALDMMVRSLRAGHPISIAMGLTAKQMPDPIGSEFGLAVDEMTYGRELQEALERVGDRIALQDFQFVVMAVTIQNATGGNLADVLAGLATLIRARFRMLKKVRALSAEGRFSAKALAAIPFVFAVLTYSINPKYYNNVMYDPLFIRIIVGAFILQIIGMFIMRRMINFRV